MNAFLIDYGSCDGCRKCVEVCCREHARPPEQSGLILSTAGPYQFPSGKEETYFIPTPTDYCDTCEAIGAQVCTKICPRNSIAFGDAQILGETMTKKKMALFVVR